MATGGPTSGDYNNYFDSELLRIANGTKDTLKNIITKMGGTVGDSALIDTYPDLANALTAVPTKQYVDNKWPTYTNSDNGQALGIVQTGENEFGYGLMSVPNVNDLIGLNIDSAKVGDIIKVAGVDDSGHPTAWTIATPGTDYLKTAPVTSVNGETGAIQLTIPT